MNRNWFTRMLMLYVPVFLIVPAFLFFAFSFSLSETNRRDAERANEFVTEQALLTIDSALSSLDQKVTLEMLRNRNVINYFTTNNAVEDDMTLQVDVMNLLQELKMANPAIHSIYMVRYSNQQVLNVSTTYPLQRFGDAEFVQSLLETPNSNWSGLRTYKELPSDDGVSVVTLTRSVSIFAKDRGMIVVNVGSDSLHAMLSRMNLSESRVLELFDRDGNDIFSHLRVDNGGTETGSSGGEFRAEKRSAYTGWTIASVHRNAQAITFMLGLSSVWFVIGIFLCGVSIAWIVYVTLRNYRPIRALVSTLQGVSEADDAGGTAHKNEFSFINARLERMINQSNAFQKQFEEDMKVKQNYLIYGLLEGTRTVMPEDWRAVAAKHGLPERFGVQRVLVFEVDRRSEWNDRYGQEEQRARQTLLEEIVRELASRSGLAVHLLWVSMYQLAAILVELEDNNGMNAESSAFADMCQEQFRERLPFSLSIGLGDSVERPDHLRDSYDEALEALRTKPAHGLGLVIPYSEERSSNDRIYAYFRQVDQLIDAFRLSEPRWKERVQELFRRLQEDGVSRDGIGNVLHYLAFYLDKAAAAMNEEYYRLWSTETMPALDRAHKEMESLVDMAAVYIQALEQYSRQVDERRGHRNQGGLMKEVKAYIEANYTNADMSLDYLQDIFGVGGKYISRLFKEEYGLKFVDYLIELRMQEAKRLLTETDQSIQDIAERVGYASPISFARTFKKATGLPPADYRKRL